ncbi:hypothetical protein ACFFUB_09310 [Algimonas porphyrae]|uniref:Uncharacterized protein n=1 Tax=Algimonas porphyrae TaxID=1128113 RepID=A0ABQ5V2J2_9PROT|nr:hypothetical protein [Algimonas porphyrae]GLQ21688.1 hypothetical protein GCM10007854_26430 [Algimonas porphyrae]
MILRRIKAHVEKENWFAVGIDFVIVVMGVFVGIQVANYNESRAEDRRERAYLERLDAEFGYVDGRLDRVIAASDTAELALLRLLQLHDEGPDRLSDDEGKTPAALMNEVVAGVFPATSPSVFEELVSDGELSVIDNSDLRSDLYEFDAVSEVALQAFQLYLNDMRDLRRILYSTLRADPANARADGLPSYGDIETLAFTPDTFFENPAFVQQSMMVLGTIDNNRELAEQQKRLVSRIETLIAEDLSR